MHKPFSQAGPKKVFFPVRPVYGLIPIQEGSP